MHGGQSPILSSLVLLLIFDPILEGAVVRDVSFFVALETFAACGEGMNWFPMVVPVPSVGGLSGPRKS